ncbi:unnamed protein product [Notodromas monacha]|uniref:Serine-threonine/tyrosine-protein kinase catalytic domain-containing protein n=1 Tax=Notodromas monacha TaxID=399045 RepID=A0A7R9BSE3_9CRUS|nr:unnamed protein product [Notodromas monacha]CAG0919333.1 unnamed protein product [Notodromas monacha]
MGCCFSSDYAGQNGLPFVKVGESTPTATTENKGVNHVFTSTASTPNVSAGSTSSRKIAVAIYDYAPPEEGLYLGIVKGEKLEVIEAHLNLCTEGMNKSQVIKKLETGYRMPKPVNVTFPDSLYKSLVLPCWDSDPDRRPTFQYAHNYLDEFMVSSESWPNRRPMI